MEQKTETVEELRKKLQAAEARERKELEAKQKAYKKKRNDYVENIVSQFKALAPQLKSLKQSALQDGSLLNNEMYEVFGKEPKSQKSITFKNSDDTMKVEISHQDKFEFDETSEVHIETIKKILEDKFARQNKTMYRIITDLLSRNKKGDWNASAVLKLRQTAEEINDPNLTEAVKQLLLSAQHSGTSDYVRVYERDKDGKYNPIVIQFSTL